MLFTSPYRFAKARQWDESQHPRDDQGQWTEAGGAVGISGNASATTSPGDQRRTSWLKKIGFSILLVGGAYMMLRSNRAPLALTPRTVITPGGRSITILGHGAARAEASVIAAVDMIPASHFAVMKSQGLRFAAIKDMGTMQKYTRAPWSAVLGGVFDPNTRILVIPQAVSFLRLRLPIPQAAATTKALHEMAHILDVKRGLSNPLKRTILTELSKPAATPMRAALVGLYRRNQHAEEVFANVYAAKYYRGPPPGPIFAGMGPSAILVAFPNTAKAMDSMHVSGQRARLLDRVGWRLGQAFDRWDDQPLFGRRYRNLENWLTRGRR